MESAITFKTKNGNEYLLVSLDEDKENNAYRIDHSGNNSFDKVFQNLKLIMDKYPNYFSTQAVCL